MITAVLEVRYACGLVLTDHVVIQASGRLTLSPRLSALLGTLEKTERRTSIRVKLDGVTYRAECKPAGEYVLGSKLSIGERWICTLQLLESPTSAQRRLSGRFAHMLSAWALIGACYIVQSTKTWGARAVIETALLCVASVSLFVIGHLCLSDSHESSQ